MRLKSQLLCASVLATLGAAALPAGTAAAQDAPMSRQQMVVLDIPAGPASSGLNTLATQADVQIFYPFGLVRDRTLPAIKGEYARDDAIRLVAEAAGLNVTRQGEAYALEDPQSGSASDGADGTVEALIVTAQKREEDIQDVPIAISAFTQEALTRSQVAGGPDLITQVPNMTFTKTNFSSYSIQLRGIGTQAISATTDPAVAVAFNNTPFIRNRFFEQEFYDLQRVEVLRGPQGTLYGRNATAGVVNIISQKPKFQFEAKASADVSNFNSSRVEGMINIPLAEDQVALRLAGAWTKRDGYAENQLTGNPIDGRDLWSTRVSLRIAPSAGIDANLIWEHFEEDDDRLRSGKQLCDTHTMTHIGSFPLEHDSQWRNAGNDGAGWARPRGMLSQGCERQSLYSETSFQTPNGNMLPYYLPLGSIGLPTALDDPYENRFQSQDLRVIESAVDPGYRATADLFELQVSIDLTDTLTLSSESSYNTDFIYSTQDFNRFNTAAGAWAVSNGPDPYDPTDQPSHAFAQGALDENGVFCDPQLGCSDRLVAVDLSTAKSRQFSQEFRVSSAFDGQFNFSLGGNFLRYDTEDKYYVFINSLSIIAATGVSFAGYDPYVVGESDNIDCMFNAYEPGDPSSVYPVTGCVYIDPNPLESVNDQGHNYFLSRNPYKLISYAVFGEAYYELAENLKLTAGLRWTVDKKDAPRIPSWLLASESVGYPVAEVIEQEWQEPTGRVAVDWKPDLAFTDETMVYASYAHGYKAGGANPPGFVRVFYVNPLGAIDQAAESETRPKTFDAEFVDAFELGSKNTLLDGSVTLNLAAFYYDYKDYQISEIVDRSAFNRNLDATIWGIELEADWRPLENLRFGFKTGYEETRIADGQSAVDLMDRTAGDPDWILVRPFPTYASSCIIPTRLLDRPEGIYTIGGGIGGGNPGPCEIVYGSGLDPLTQQPYQPGVTFPNVQGFTAEQPYTGFDPASAPNGGEGISKDISGNDLPNAPNLTATITADYTIPFGDWLATLHTDLHWQGESDWRVFQDHEYSKLDEYFTMNLAAIFINEEHGWNIMAYIKNVTDETAITGAFLNSDDTGLTTNVFLTEPRLYGLRVTKAWTGGPLWGPFGERRDGPFPLTVELGGQIQRHDAPNAPVAPTFGEAFTGPLDIVGKVGDRDLDWGDGREVKLTFRPSGKVWSIWAAARFGRTNGRSIDAAEHQDEPVCALGAGYEAFCEYYIGHPLFDHAVRFAPKNRADVEVYDREDHTIIDFVAAREVGFGRLSRSEVGLGLRFARLNSQTSADLHGIPDWTFEAGFYLPFPGSLVTHTLYEGVAEAHRRFEGAGPMVTWQASHDVLSSADWGALALDWALSAGALFGEHEVSVSSTEEASLFEFTGAEVWNRYNTVVKPKPDERLALPPLAIRRSESATVPVADVSLGLSYRTGPFNFAAGYRWERYFDAIDGGVDEAKDEDRTIDGPYFKLSVGFGG